MISGEMRWEGDAMDQIKALAWEKIARVTAEYHAIVGAELNVSNPRPYKTPSAPGEPPRKRTGLGKTGVVYELDKKAMTGRVGPTENTIYMAFLDLGTSRVAARPWLFATARKYFSRLQAIVQG